MTLPLHHRPLTTLLAGTLLTLALLPCEAASPPGRPLTTTELLNYAESAYPALFPSREINQVLAPYTYRYYPGTGNYLGVADRQVYVLGPVSGGAVQRVGALDDFYCAASPLLECELPARPVTDASGLADLAARGIDSLFYYQTVLNSIVFDMLNLLAPSAVTGRPAAAIAGTRALNCLNGGSGSYTVSDPDDSHTLTPGDRITVTGNNCIMTSLTGHPSFTGRLDINLTGGANTHNYWASTAEFGSIELRVDLQALNISRGVLSGIYRYGSYSPSPDADYTTKVVLENLTAQTQGGSMVYTDVTLNFTADTLRLAAAEGAITVRSNAGGLKRLQLSVAQPMDVVQDTIRPRPQNGALRLTGDGFQIDLRFAPNRQMSLSLDNGPIGKSALSLSTTEADLDGLLKSP